MIEGEKIIEVRNLVKYYGNFCAVENVSFDVYQGDVFGINKILKKCNFEFFR